MRWASAEAGRRRGRAGARLRAAVAVAVAALLVAPAHALDADEPVLRTASLEIGEIERERERARAELEALGAELETTEETTRALDAEIEAIAKDRETIRAAMIEAAEAQRRASAEIAASEEEIAQLRLREGRLTTSLHARRGTLAEVLGALERMGRRPPPAILVHPDDALGSVRSAILLGSVVPTIRQETDALRRDLDELAALRTDIEEQRQAFAASLQRQREEEGRLARLSQEREKLEADRREALTEMAARGTELAGRASSLEELIGALESDLAAAQAAEDEARRIAAREAAEAEARRLATLAEEDARRDRVAAAQRSADPAGMPRPGGDPQVEMAALEPETDPAKPAYDIDSLRREMNALEVSAPFSTLEGSLVRPVAGETLREFGKDDGFGRRSEGVVFAARAGDLVTAPADGRILYSGPFRSYGQLLILNAGDGYHIVLAGMREIDVDVGQFVLAGEPVAVMGARRLASAGNGDLPSTDPSLYVEFRKDGKPVDPDPWWIEGASGRTRNDS